MIDGHMITVGRMTANVRRPRYLIRFMIPAVLAAGVFFLSVASQPAYAAGPNDNFSLQITPSPIVQTVKPGVKTTTSLQLRNNGSGTEDLKMEVRRFTFDDATGQIAIDDTAAADLSRWVTFGTPKFSVASGQVFDQNVVFNFPADSGFSYSFVVVISRQNEPQATGGGRLLQGSIADFGLVNIDRPGAKQALELSSFKASAGVYEYVPATLSLTFKNTGNTIVSPAGNVFIGRGNAEQPLATLKVNDSSGYILPGTTRTLTTTWGDGFPRTESQTLSDGTTKTSEVWNIGDIGKFRIGPYTARAVAVYNNGSYDVPLNAETTFWIIPWKILLGAFVIVLVLGLGVFVILRGLIRGVRRGRRKTPKGTAQS